MPPSHPITSINTPAVAAVIVGTRLKSLLSAPHNFLTAGRVIIVTAAAGSGHYSSSCDTRLF